MPLMPTAYIGSPRVVPDFGAAAELLTDFSGIDESPLSDGNKWTPTSSGSGTLQRVSNQVGNTVTTTNDSFWWSATWKDVDSYITIATKPAVNVDGVVILARANVIRYGSSSFNAYGFGISTQAGTDTWNIYRIDNVGFNSLLQGQREFTNGEKIGIRCLGNNISGWIYDGTSWIKMGEVYDDTYSAAGYVGIRGRGTSFRIDDFYLGEIS